MKIASGIVVFLSVFTILAVVIGNSEQEPLCLNINFVAEVTLLHIYGCNHVMVLTYIYM